ncbi:hypothetical protein BS329_15615 [Amycolatopsis coloradensis]|uniref:CobQ/CobB/MinD/ParA nucleotide binding domain-containing protein n=1 Tax=Amycolatopsis coloradensis TaxID=76021 RepID=A0A1R0KUA9_9PSEU|nr:AAA family ATPase [Amycolatopsis coloradensis]OLZ51691.1 hypothetical protein BS329_15615 [Amycolatopsis coloradensis]
MAVQPRIFGLPAKRRAYTGESHQQARQRLVQQRQQGGGPLVPDTSGGQAAFEAEVLSLTAAAVGPHHPADLGGAYGISAVSPTATGLDLTMTDLGIADLVEAILPRALPAKDSSAAALYRVTGLPGLRYVPLTRGRIRLYRLGHDGDIVLVDGARTWRHAADALAAGLPAGAIECWTHDELTDAEFGAAPSSPVDILAWSRVLRRIALWRKTDLVDLSRRFPSPQQIAGPHPDLLADGDGRTPIGRTVAIVSRKGGLGRSALLLQAAAVWAQQGLRVLIADLDEQGTLTHSTAGRNQERDPAPWSGVRGEAVLHRGPTGGELRIVPGPSDGPQGPGERWRHALEAAKSYADLILLDTGPLNATPDAAFATDMADAVVICFPYPPGHYDSRYTEPQLSPGDHSQYPAPMLAWLTEGFRTFVAYCEESEGEHEAAIELLRLAARRTEYTGEPLDLAFQALAEDFESEDDAELVREYYRGISLDLLDRDLVQTLQAPFLQAVEDSGRGQFGADWDPDGWRATLLTVSITEAQVSNDVPAPSFSTPEADGSTDTGRGERDDLVDDGQVIADVNRLVKQFGTYSGTLAGAVVAAVPVGPRALPKEAAAQLTRLANDFSCPIMPHLVVGRGHGTVQSALESGELLAVTRPNHATARAWRSVADSLLPRITATP